MDNENTVSGEVKSSGKSKKVLLAVIVIALLAVVGYFVFGKGKLGSPVVKAESVATVNGVEITKATFDKQLASAIASYKAQGTDVTASTTLAQIQTQVLDTLINNELLAQGVKLAGIQVTLAEVETQYQTILTQNGGAEGLKTALAQNNLTDAQLRENITKQLATQKYLLANIDVSKITVTDAEIAQFYTDYSKAQKAAGQATVPALKDLSAQIKQQLTSNKETALVNEFVAGLKAKATIVKTI